MTDLEITRKCAEAIGYPVELAVCNGWKEPGKFDPLHDDAQAMALVKKFGIWIESYMPPGPQRRFKAYKLISEKDKAEWTVDLNRAICECVAKMQEAK